MTFINNFKITNKPFFVKNKVYMLNKNNVTIYNPIIGSNLGVPLNLLQYIYTTSHYGENIINYDLILLQFAIGIFTYGTDRFLDALEYDTYTYSNNSTYNLSARKIKSSEKYELEDFTTGSLWSPYITTIGLYNEANELLVVGKLAQPIKCSDETDTTFVLRWDT